MTAKLRLGILGTANIARHLAAGVAGSDTVEVVAVASRTADAAAAFAGRTGIPRALPTYEALLDDPAVDAIYNPLPNALHAEWTIRALRAGKPVLCEKPIAVTAADARAMYAAAHDAGLLLVEAYPYRSQPQTHALARLLRSGEIGRPRVVQASFGFPRHPAGNIRLDPALGGGALLDAGCYAVSLVHLIAGAAPVRVTADAQWHDTGTDDALVADLVFADGMLAQVACSFGTGLYRRAMIACEDGTVSTDFLNHLTADAPGRLEVHRGGWTPTVEQMDFPALNGFRAEAESFAAAVREGPAAWNGIGEAESIAVMETLEAILKSARDGGSVDVAAG